MPRRSLPVRRTAHLVLGLASFGVAIALMIRASLGLAPWDVLAQGIAERTGWSFGLVVNLIGVVVLALWFPLRQRPGVGTVLNVLVIGPSADLALWLLPAPAGLAWRVLAFVVGLTLVAVATGLYLGARFGPGPRDGLMTGLHTRTGRPVGLVRTGIEVVALAVGWALGGNVGPGTLAFALLIGPMVGVALPLLRVPEPATASTPALEPAVAPAPMTL